jgi:hypothetical protein
MTISKSSLRNTKRKRMTWLMNYIRPEIDFLVRGFRSSMQPTTLVD